MANPSRRTARIRLLFALLLPLSAASCTVTLASSYDEQIDRSATTLQRRMDGFLTAMEAEAGAPAGAYAPNAPFYRDYLVDLRAVRVRADAHEDNDITLKQLALMENSVEELRSTHEEQDRISAAAARTYRDLFNTAWRAIIRWEVAKKRGES